MKLVRDNDDPKLLADLDRLAGREPVAPTEAAADAAGAEAAEAAPLDDPFVRRFVQVSVHLKRYLPFYVGAAVWALTMLLIQPLGKDKGADVASGPAFAGTPAAATATAAPASAVADLGADAVAAPTFETVTGAAFSDTSTDFSAVDTSEFAAGSPSTDSGASSSDFTTDTTIAFDDSEFGSDEPKKLTITKSGYASATGGTPAEQEPANGGLPVAATAGQDTKRTYLALEGDGSQLRMKVVTDGAINADTAVLKLCKVTAPWQAERGMAISNAPAFDPACSTGSVLDGVWTFDLTPFSAEDRVGGLTITPGAGTALTFQVVFDPTPEPTENA